jgi:hypothetical protein
VGELSPLLHVAKKETYLDAEEFEVLFGMTQEAFASLAKWKQQQLKKTHDLF